MLLLENFPMAYNKPKTRYKSFSYKMIIEYLSVVNFYDLYNIKQVEKLYKTTIDNQDKLINDKLAYIKVIKLKSRELIKEYFGVIPSIYDIKEVISNIFPYHHFFDKDTLKFFGQTMSSFNVVRSKNKEKLYIIAPMYTGSSYDSTFAGYSIRQVKGNKLLNVDKINYILIHQRSMKDIKSKLKQL